MGTQAVAAPVTGRPAAARGARVARWLHPVAWWIWALGLLVAGSATSNPAVLTVLLCVLALVVARRRPDAPWAGAFGVSLRLGAVVIASRMLLQVVFNVPVGIHVAFWLPAVSLPDWLAGIRLGGMVTWESLLVGFSEGLRLAVMIAAVGAANSLASPSRLLRSVPAALYEVGVAVVVALSVTPNLLADARRVSAARRLRGFDEGRVRSFARSAGPVMEGGLERSIELAAAMDARGYGRLGQIPARSRHLHSILVLAACTGVLVGLFALFDTAAPRPLGWSLLLASVILAVAAVRAGGARRLRTSYRPDPWAVPEWLTAATGVVVALGFLWLSGSPGLAVTTSPLAWPAVPGGAVAVLLLGLLPGFVTPLPPGLRPMPRLQGGPR